MSGTISCKIDSAGFAECAGVSDWTSRGSSPIRLDGRMERAASSSVSFCPPGGLCRSFGVGFLIVGCSWAVASDGCGLEDTYPLSTGRWHLDAGECLEATLSTAGWVAAWRDPSPEALAAQALPYSEATDSVCA